MSTPPKKTIRLKCFHNNEIRVVRLRDGTSFTDLKERLNEDYGTDGTSRLWNPVSGESLCVLRHGVVVTALSVCRRTWCYVRMRSARISNISHFHISITSEEYHSTHTARTSLEINV